MNLCITERDKEVFATLAKLPLTTEQLLRFSKTFVEPFYNQRILERRLNKLCETGYLNRYFFGLPRKGRSPSYWRIRSKSHRLIGSGDERPRKSLFQKIGNHFHAYHVNEVAVRAILSARENQMDIVRFSSEETLTLAAQTQTQLVPDAVIEVAASKCRTYRFFIEIDTGSERVNTTQTLPSSIRKKLDFYERYRLQHGNSFRVLFVTTSSKQRAENILRFSGGRTTNRAAQTVYAAYFEELKKHSDWMTDLVFRNHRLQPVPLVPRCIAK